MFKRVFLSLLGLFCLDLSMKTFPIFHEFNFQILLQKLVFEFFKIFGAIILFIIGFLAISRVIKGIYEKIKERHELTLQYCWMIIVATIFLYLSLQSVIGALLAFVFSMFYGIMDANTRQKAYHKS